MGASTRRYKKLQKGKAFSTVMGVTVQGNAEYEDQLNLGIKDKITYYL